MNQDVEPSNALGERLRALHGPLTGYFMREVGDRTEAEDLVQEVYLRVIRRGPMESYDRLAAYVFLAAGSVLKDRHRLRITHRSDRHMPLETEEYQDPAPGAERQVIARDTLRSTSIALAQLPDRTRAVFVLRRLDGMSFAEISRRLGISISAAEKNMLRATRHLIAHARVPE